VASGSRRTRFLRPVFFMENLLAPYSLHGDTLAWALGPGTKLQMIAVDDIGISLHRYT
jgi:hypothetical protein